MVKRAIIGIFAHVDAGKTTLSEAILYKTGAFRKLGRVDHGDAFLDTDSMEKQRGITIFAKQARMEYGDMELVLIDTPGHVDFGAEAERAMSVLDCAILVISGPDGVQAHTETLWNLLKLYDVPTFIFINKSDLDGFDRDRVMDELAQRFGDGFFELDAELSAEVAEEIATLDEDAMEEFLESETLSRRTLAQMVASRKLFPCSFGSALKVEGVEDLLDQIAELATPRPTGDSFSAQVYKITHDSRGERLTWLKVTGGSLHVKDLLSGGDPATKATQASIEEAGWAAVNGWHPGPNAYIESNFGKASSASSSKSHPYWEQKVNQIRLYSGEKFQAVESVKAGQVCAVSGLSSTYAGETLGQSQAGIAPVLQPALSYQVILPSGFDTTKALRILRVLEDEDPMLHVVWNERLQEIHVQLMGEIQLEVVQQQLRERYELEVDFGAGSILYRETISKPSQGCGHFEPLRHYAETRLMLEPLPAGSGILVGSTCPEDTLDLNWQRLIVTHLLEREHIGTLIGAPITDMRITLINGRAHNKHTEGGDFRQATYRALRQGLMRIREQGGCELLEPWYSFTLEVPQDQIGRALADIQRMCGSFGSPESNGQFARISGKAPVSEMNGYHLEVNAYTHGLGRLSCVVDGYERCHNQQQVVDAADYDPKADLENTPDSVFCSHGAGYPVDWFDVEEHMHTEG